ncbi:MAG TPA: hypothetical protein VE888_20610 [Streptosporangiaceae bacterium]|nr:hypothetical protein [Streptosporangiaceae bacterium]
MSPGRPVCQCDGGPARCGWRVAGLHRRGLGDRGQRQRRVPARHGHPRPDRCHRAAGPRDGHRALPVPWPTGRRPYRDPDHQGGKALRHRNRDDVRRYPPAAGRARNAWRSVASRRTRAHRGRTPRTARTRGLRPRAAGRHLPAPVHGPGRSAPASRRRRLRYRAPIRAAADARLVRLPGAEPVDTVALLCAVDAFPPTVFNARLPIAWTPTVELTAHIRARPASGWLRCRFATRFVSAGFLEEDGEVWDSTGRLVGQSRQLALVPRAEVPPQ